jgi:hypothetical protein
MGTARHGRWRGRIVPMVSSTSAGRAEVEANVRAALRPAGRCLALRERRTCVLSMVETQDGGREMQSGEGDGEDGVENERSMSSMKEAAAPSLPGPRLAFRAGQSQPRQSHGLCRSFSSSSPLRFSSPLLFFFVQLISRTPFIVGGFGRSPLSPSPNCPLLGVPRRKSRVVAGAAEGEILMKDCSLPTMPHCPSPYWQFWS